MTVKQLKELLDMFDDNLIISLEKIDCSPNNPVIDVYVDGNQAVITEVEL